MGSLPPSRPPTGSAPGLASGHTIWLRDNAWRFGFILRYPADKTPITGYSFEPWHFRYVGTDLATSREAVETDKQLADHLAHLVVHGTLHLFGFDHEVEGDAERMEALEIELLAGLGIADPYSTAAQP